MTHRNIWTLDQFPSLTDYVIIGVYLIIIFMISSHIKNQKIDKNPAYRYLVWGLFAKIVGAIALCIVYLLHYGLADTLGYYISSEALINLLFENPSAYFSILFGDYSREAMSSFTSSTGYPWYRHDHGSFFIVRITSIFTLLGFKNYFTTSILFATFFFTGFWKLFLLFSHLYPKYSKHFAIAVFFVPSTLFWASGILKDTVSLSMMGWMLHAAYFGLVEKQKKIKNLFVLLLTGYVILVIKPYILVALIPGTLIWLGWNYLKRIHNIVLRLFLLPTVVFVFLAMGFTILNLLSPYLGEYGSIDTTIQKAIITYEDHTRAVQYGDNYYDLGTFDGTFNNFISKAPEAIMAGLFRPFIWEIKNLLMLLAALENLILMIIVMNIFWRSGLAKTLQIVFDEPLVVFTISFAIVFAFAVGISTANFGALARLKTPLLPLLVAGLFTLNNKSKELKEKQE